MREELLQILREPGTGAEFELAASEMRDREIWEGVLRSTSTGREYPIHSGIPRFVPSDDYTESFGIQWKRFSRVQLDSANGAKYSQRRFHEEVGWSSSQLEGQWVLDAGCGSGRFAEVAAGLGAWVIALDYSTAVDAAAQNLRIYPNVHYIQGDILNPPLRRRSLGFLYSIGVLQHTPDPRAAITSLLSLLSHHGQFAFTIYARRWYTHFYSKYLVRSVTRRLSPASLLLTIEAMMPVLFPVTNVLFPIPIFGKVAQFAIPVANYVHKSDFTREQRYREAILDTFDMLASAYDHPMTATEVREVFNRVGVREFRFLSTVPINVKGLAPPMTSPVEP